ncbi:MAG: hypothetical protein AAB512_04455 [Patescibacteria group bacterium]
MGTTRVKVIDLSSQDKEIKTARKHAEKLVGINAKVKKEEVPSQEQVPRAETPEEQKDLSGQNQAELKEETPAAKPKPTKTKKSTHHKGAKYLAAKALVEDKNYTLADALDILPKTATTKFDSTVEIHLNVTDKNLKVSLSMPHLKTEVKQKKVLIFSDKKKDTDNKGIIWATDKTIADIESGALKATRDFDQVVATPKFMPILAKVAKILGPKGLMPNPKNGTVTETPEKFLDAPPDTKAVIKSDPTAPIIHTKIGKVSQKPDELSQNVKALTSAIGLSKITSAVLTTSMGPSIRLEVPTLK